MSLRSFRLLLIAASLIVLGGCASAPPKQTALMQRMGGSELTKRQLQTLVYAYGYHYAGQVELVTTEIVAETSDREIRRTAITWNTIGVPEMLRTCFSSDPMVGLFLAWTYAAQTREYFETGFGRDVFGPYQARVVEVSKQLENQARNIAYGTLAPAPADSIAKRVDAWVIAHPLRNHRFVREGFSREALDAMGTDVSGGLAAAGEMNEQMVALTDRTNLMMGYLPRQIEWQTASALDMSEKMVDEVADSTIAAVGREALANLDPLLQFIAEQRRLTIEDLARERMTVLEHISTERLRVLQELHGERIATIAAMHEMTLEAIEKVSAQGGQIATSSIDRASLRLGQLVLLPLAVLLAIVIVSMIWMHRMTQRFLMLRERESGQGR